MYGSAPQPTNRSSFRVVWALPCDAATSPSGWLSDAISVAVRERSSSLTVTARLTGNSGVPADSLSKNVYRSCPTASGSCCQAKIVRASFRDWPGAACRRKLEALPPSCQMIWPVKRLTLYVVHVSRASISRLPSVSKWTALIWNQSHGVLADAGSGCSLWLYGTWSALFHWNRTLPVVMSISCTTPLITVWLAGPPIEVRLAVAVV